MISNFTQIFLGVADGATPKFFFIAGCLAVAIISGVRCVSRRDWLWLVGALSFTLAADYFLVLRNNHLAGVAVFCFAHVCHIARAAEWRGQNQLVTICNRLVFAIFLIAWVLAAFVFRSVIGLAAIYATLFAANIFVNTYKNRRPKVNYYLVAAGLLLFALCDVNVLLFNLPRYASASYEFSGAYALIWLFYLPAQALLAVSSISAKRPKFIHKKVRGECDEDI